MRLHICLYWRKGWATKKKNQLGKALANRIYMRLVRAIANWIALRHADGRKEVLARADANFEKFSS